MRRLVYAPKAFAFIASSNLNQIVDVSDDIVSGEVVRNVNDASSAKLILRNVNRKYITTGDGTQIFLPNDLITIWLQRVAGKPIQVFTGYLDEVPMYQGLPGDCILEATCTLKKLAHSYFDPGLDFFINWANKFDGWIINPTTGQAENSGISLGVDATTGDQAQKVKNDLDGGFAKLMFEFMIQIAGWAPDKILVSEIDAGLPEKAADLYNRTQELVEQDQSALADALREMMGIELIADVEGITESGRTTTQVQQITETIEKTVGDYGIPTIFAVFAAKHRSNYRPQLHVMPSNKGKPVKDWGYGLYRAQPAVRSVDVDFDWAGGTDTGGAEYEGSVEGVVIDQLGDPALATTVFCRQAVKGLDKLYPPPNGTAGAAGWQKERSGFLKRIERGEIAAVKKLMEAMGYEVNTKTYFDDFDVADRYIKSMRGMAVTQPGEEGGEATIRALNWDSPELVELLEPAEKTLVRDHYSKSLVELTPYLYWAKKQNKDLKLAKRKNQGKETLYIESTGTKDGRDLFQTFRGHDEIEEVLWKQEVNMGTDLIFQLVKGQAAANWSTSDVSEAGKTMPANHLRIMVKAGAEVPNWVGLPVTPDTDDNTPGGDGGVEAFKFSDLGRFTTNAALAARYSFPIDYVQSQLLTGNRALMNDISCLDGVKQFAQASMRNFMSLPDGRFCAFYPDYFGAKRAAYWNIYNIEIVNMGIQLNDRALATHVFVAGDAVNFNNEVDWMDRIGTKGVVTVYNIELLNSFINPGANSLTRDKNSNIDFDESKASKFLNRYGARPVTEENPIIRNPFFEFLMAWQRFMQLWASQFATRMEFTFQPEVFAGGLIGFPEHHLQMYVEQVTHSWSYDSGFETQATLSSPSKIGGADATHLPGMVLAGGVNTVGAAG